MEELEISLQRLQVAHASEISLIREKVCGGDFKLCLLFLSVHSNLFFIWLQKFILIIKAAKELEEQRVKYEAQVAERDAKIQKLKQQISENLAGNAMYEPLFCKHHF